MQQRNQPLRTIGILGLTVSAITCIIGSGWLFGAYQAAKIAGPAAIFSWMIGGLAILLVALTIIELATIFPASGGMARYLNYSHGSLSGFLSGWANWLAIVTVIPAEAAASIQYLSSWNYTWCHQLFSVASGQLTLNGFYAAVGLVFVYFLLNYWTVKLLMRFLIGITIIKVLVPILTIIILFSVSFHPGNFHLDTHSFAPYGWSAMLTAVSTCGIIFAFNGFQTPVNFAAEAKRPQVTLPLALIFSIVFCIILYVFLEIAFIGALSPALLNANNWHALSFSSPYAQLAISLNLNLLLLMLYADAFASPSATAVAYMGSTARMLYGMQQHGYMPGFLGILHDKYLIPRGALWINLLTSLIFLFFYRGWSGLAAVISVATVVSYLTGPVAVMGLRRIADDIPRPVKMPFLEIIAPLAFVVMSLVFFWSCWPLTGQIILVLSLGLIIYFYYQVKNKIKGFRQDLKASYWLIFYLFTMAALSYIGDKSFGGINILPAGWDQLIVAIVGLGFYNWGVRSAWRTPELEKIKKNSLKER